VRSSDDPDCDYETCFSARGVLQGQVVDARIGVAGTKVLVNQVFIAKMSADEVLSDAGEEEQNGFFDEPIYILLLLLIFSWGGFAHQEKGGTRNRLLDTGLMLLVVGGIIVAAGSNVMARVGDWSTFRFAVSLSAMVLGFLSIFGAMILWVAARMRRVEKAQERQESPTK
jgi:hypothetical protein